MRAYSFDIWLETDIAIEYLTRLEDIFDEDVDNLKLIKSRFKAITSPLQAHAKKVIDYSSKK